MGRVFVLTGDLLFGSRLQASLTAAGHQVDLVAGEEELRAALARGCAQALLVDLTDERLNGVAIVSALAQELDQTHTLAYYAHVDTAARESALSGGIERAVPRSRIAREAAELVADLIATAP